jgi:regulator of sigma E protease
MITVLSFLVVLMILVMTHELGHLIAAKRLGVEARTFAIGFGPKVASVRWKGTDYVYRLIPLGGYVQLGETSPEDGFRPGSPHFSERPPLDKIIVAFCGPLANLLLAVAVLSLVSVIGIESPTFMDRPALLGWVGPASPAAFAGLGAGDRIVEVDGNRVSTWAEMIKSIPLYERDEVRVTFLRGDRAGWAVLPRVSRINIGLAPQETVTIGTVAAGSPADGAGLRTGDVMCAIDGQPLLAWGEFQERVSHAKSSLAVTIERAGRRATVQITPKWDPKAGRKLAGISYRPEIAVKKYSFPGAVVNGFSRTGEIVSDSLGTFRGLVTGGLSLKTLGGPVAIAQASGATAKAGITPLLAFLAFLSIQLGIFNLLPFIPIVDGGQITLFLFETLLRRPIGVAFLEWFSRVGWAAMGVLILFVTYNDILRLF